MSAWVRCRRRESFQPVYRSPYVSMQSLYTRCNEHPLSARCRHSRRRRFSLARPRCFPERYARSNPPAGIARRGKVIFLGSRNNFPNPPFRSSGRPKLRNRVHPYAGVVKFGERGCTARRERVACSGYALVEIGSAASREYREHRVTFQFFLRVQQI